MLLNQTIVERDPRNERGHSQTVFSGRSGEDYPDVANTAEPLDSF